MLLAPELLRGKFLVRLRSDIEQAVDQDSGKMQARLKYIAIEQLVHYAGKKVKPQPYLCIGTAFPIPGVAMSQTGACQFGHCQSGSALHGNMLRMTYLCHLGRACAALVCRCWWMCWGS